jgi:hypothetical protein
VGERGVTLIPAMELSCEVDGVDVHILAYAFDALDERIELHLQFPRDAPSPQLCNSRQAPHPRTEDFAGASVNSRPAARWGARTSRALSSKPATSPPSATPYQYLGTGKRYIGKERFAIARPWRDSRGGVLSIAHMTIDALLIRVSSTPASTPSKSCARKSTTAIASLTNLARFRGKFTTGGSDDHGTVKTAETLGTIRVPEAMIGPILERM